jgi:hypothetical protein
VVVVSSEGGARTNESRVGGIMSGWRYICTTRKVSTHDKRISNGPLLTLSSKPSLSWLSCFRKDRQSLAPRIQAPQLIILDDLEEWRIVETSWNGATRRTEGRDDGVLDGLGEEVEGHGRGEVYTWLSETLVSRFWVVGMELALH